MLFKFRQSNHLYFSALTIQKNKNTQTEKAYSSPKNKNMQANSLSQALG